jgi:hypothetical protein
VTEYINVFQVRIVGTMVAVLMLLAVVVRAASSVRSEHERNTFDELYTTRLTNGEILFGKWIGAILSVRWAWAWLGLIWAVSAALGGVQVAAFPLVVASWVTYAAVAAGVGLWFSIGSKTTLRATVASLVTVLFLLGGHWLVAGMFCYIPLKAFRVAERSYEWMWDVQLGQTPPFVMGLFAYHGGMEFGYPDLEDKRSMWTVVRLTVSSLFGVGCWAALLPVLWFLVKKRFEQVSGRVAVHRPERAAPRPRRGPPPKKALLIDPEPAAAAANGNGEVLEVTPVDEPAKEKEEQAPP